MPIELPLSKSFGDFAPHRAVDPRRLLTALASRTAFPWTDAADVKSTQRANSPKTRRDVSAPYLSAGWRNVVVDQSTVSTRVKTRKGRFT